MGSRPPSLGEIMLLLGAFALGLSARDLFPKRRESEPMRVQRSYIAPLSSGVPTTLSAASLGGPITGLAIEWRPDLESVKLVVEFERSEAR